jgi:hypothetical protein
MKFLPGTKRELAAVIVGWAAGYLLLALVVGGYFWVRAQTYPTNCVKSAPIFTEGLRAWLYKGPSAVYVCLRLVKNGQSVDLVSFGRTDVTFKIRYTLRDGAEQLVTLKQPEYNWGMARFSLSIWNQVLEGTSVNIDVKVVLLDAGETFSTQTQYTPPFTPFKAYP